jgi:3-hydroxyisobutyrate dehydrogenase-like beta-hydroxyacid dehydrogenase
VKVGWLGLGRMGGPMCDHVLAAGHDVAVFDPLADAVASRVERGARAAATPADAAAGAEAVAVVVRDDEQALDALLGVDGVLRGAPRGARVLVHSTLAPVTVRTLHAAGLEAGVDVLDVPISGGTAGAAAGTLFLLVGGDPESIDAVRPLLDCYGGEVVRFGDVGAGMAAKLVRNMLQYTLFGATQEAMELAEAAGLDLGAVAHLVRATQGGSHHDALLDRPSTRPFDPDEDPARTTEAEAYVRLAWKDLADAFQLADEVGVAVPVARTAPRAYGAAMGRPLPLPPDLA